MALELIELGTELEYIDVDVSKVPYSFNIKLLDKTYKFIIKYNDVGSFFTIDLFDLNGEVLALGEVVRFNRPLFNVVEDENFPIPVIVPTCLVDDSINEVTFSNFGKEVKLYLYERVVG